MKVYSLLIFVLVFCLFFSCQEHRETDSSSFFKEKLYNKKLIDSLDNLALNKGDTLAYSELRTIHYIGQQRLDGFLYYALVMSNKYRYKKASYDVYEILMFNEQALDSATKQIANEYLLKSQSN